MGESDTRDVENDRPPICPACGVTMGITMDDGVTRFVCLECGFPHESSHHSHHS